MKPFRFGVHGRSATSAAEWAQKARTTEDQGYAVLSMPDHLTELLAPLPALLAAASATTRLRVATEVLNNDFRHPVLVAREAATVDLLTGGRFELGLGGGWMKAEYDQAGLTFDEAATRVDRLAEAVTIVKRLLDGEETTFEGRHYRVTAHRIHPRPVQQPHPPIFVGGNARRVLTLAAQQADIVGFTGIIFREGGTKPDVSGFKATAVDERVRLVREAAGDRFDALELNALVQRVVVTDDRRAAAEDLARQWSRVSAEDLLQSPHVLIGSVDSMVEDLQARRERWGISYVTVFEPVRDVFAPVVARLAGH
ncbi:MAG: LLM class F420-dependent oxidoreductase [Candidatus Rokubacteria bacterium]|nr:LLM class F420-dependent oxidoreductase [Candidatus Rokubacteria bacterium]MBI3824522.1 LLM class F420-dependent oxidoreductase [Candidatus Rokubacteria bacterium]